MLQRIQAELRDVRCVSMPVNSKDATHGAKDSWLLAARDRGLIHDPGNRFVIRFVELSKWNKEVRRGRVDLQRCTKRADLTDNARRNVVFVSDLEDGLGHGCRHDRAA